MKRTPLLVAILLLVFGTGTALHAYPRHHRKIKKRQPLPEQYEVLDSVNVSTGTLNTHHVGGLARNDRTFSVSGFTEVTVNGAKASLADLRPGMRVDYTMGGDGSSLASIKTVAAPAPTPTPSYHTSSRRPRRVTN